MTGLFSFVSGAFSQARERKKGKRLIFDLVSAVPATLMPIEVLKDQIEVTAQNGAIPDADQRRVVTKAWINAVETLLHETIPSEEQEKHLAELIDAFSLSRAELEESGSFLKLVKAATLRDAMQGIIPHRCTISGDLLINLQKGEEVVWAFPNCDYLQDRTLRQYVGGSQGVSVRVMKGVYYRVGAFKGQAVERTSRELIDSGVFVLTNRGLYFTGAQKTFRIPFSKIVSFKPYSDGIGIVRDGANAKQQIFVTGDGWFAYNLATNLAHI